MMVLISLLVMISPVTIMTAVIVQLDVPMMNSTVLVMVPNVSMAAGLVTVGMIVPMVLTKILLSVVNLIHVMQPAVTPVISATAGAIVTIITPIVDLTAVTVAHAPALTVPMTVPHTAVVVMTV